MKNKTIFVPSAEVNTNMSPQPSNLVVYRSSVPGATTLMMTDDDEIRAGIRLTNYQALNLVEVLLGFLAGASDIGYDAGYRAGFKDGFEAGSLVAA